MTAERFEPPLVMARLGTTPDSHPHLWDTTPWLPEPIELSGIFRVERHFTYNDPDFAAKMRVLPNYTVSILNPNITGVKMPMHE